MPARTLAVALVLALVSFEARSAQQLSANGTWGVRKPTTSRGKVLWYDADAVWLYNGTTNVQVQAHGALGNIDNIVFSLGSGATASSVIGAWRRGQDHAWLYVEGSSPVELVPPNPFGNANPLNPEAVAIADGCVFLGWQATNGNGFLAQHVFKVDPVTNNVTNLTGTAAVKGRRSPIATSQCKAVWYFNNTNSDTDPTYDLHYYNGTTVVTIDADKTLGNPAIGNGLIAYTKRVAGVTQVFVYDTNAVSPVPVQVTSYTSSTQSVYGVKTDGRFVAWGVQNGGTSTRHLMTMGGGRLTDASTAGLVDASDYFPLHLDRGQFLWTDNSGALRYAEGSSAVTTIPLTPATSQQRPFLADGSVAWLGNAGGVYLHTAVAPTATPPPAAINATAGIGSAEVSWTTVFGASSHTLYLAKSSGVTKQNYERRIAGVSSPYVVTGLDSGATYFFVVTATENGLEGPVSREASVTIPSNAWARGFGIGDVTVYDVKSDRANASVLYAAVADARGVWRSADGGTTWTPLSGAVNGRDVRAVAANGTTVLAMTKDGDILRSLDGGSTWTVELDGVDIGEQQKVLVIDPSNASVLYAADTAVSGNSANYVVKSTDGGDTWSQLPDSAAGEIRAYSIAVDTATANTLYACGTGTPVVKSVNGGTTWTDVQPSGGFFYAIAVAPSQPTTLFTSGVNFSQTSLGVFKSTNGASTWTAKNNGFPVTLPKISALLVEPTNPLRVHAGGQNGYYRTTDGADSWSAGPAGSSSVSVNALAITSSRRLVAASTSGIHLLPLNAAPSVSGLAPGSGPTGTEVVISGNGFDAAAGLRVTFDGIDGTVNLAASSAGSITVAAPAHAIGAVAVTVINPDGQAVGAGTFTYVACAFALAPSSANFTSSAATGLSVSVSTSNGCAWNASAPGGSFVTITSGASGSGNGTVTYDLAQNAGTTARTTTITIGTASFVVTQAAAGLTVPTLTAASGSAAAALSWTAVSGAASYEVWRSTGGQPFAFLTATGGTSHSDATITNGTAALYRVHALNGASGVLAYSNVDFATRFTYTDSTLSAGGIIRAAHWAELRQVVNAIRTALGWPALSFTGSIALGTPVLRTHATELRTAADAVRAAVGLPAYSYADPAITAHATPIRSQHVVQLRAAVD